MITKMEAAAVLKLSYLRSLCNLVCRAFHDSLLVEKAVAGREGRPGRPSRDLNIAPQHKTTRPNRSI